MSGLDDDDKGEPEAEVDDEVESVEDSAEELDEDFSDELDDEADPFDDTDEDLKVVDEALSHKDQNARALAIRRAIEERLESKRLSKDLDYLDLDLDADD